MDQEDRELLEEFKAEAEEHLGHVERFFVEIEEAAPQVRAALVADVFRALHSVKGTSGFFELTRIESLAHAMESVLAALRDGEAEFTPALSDLLLGSLDKLAQMIAALPELQELEVDAEIEALTNALSNAEAPAPSAPVAETGSSAPKRPAPRASETIRVPVRLLDQLVNLAGELVLSRNQLASHLSGAPRETQTMIQGLDLVTSELQNSIMNARMQPVDTVFQKFHRIVRDLARKLGRHVRLELVGTRVELDRSILELLADPLTHLVRNALDHGIEPPEERAAAGKPEEAVLRISACQRAGQVEIEIEDDGHGVDPERIRAAAVARGILEESAARRLSDREAIDLIFAPGFSTAEQVTDVSGRGVGMDVVQTNMSKLGGKIGVESDLGRGTRVRIWLPLTLAIVPALVVEVAGTRFTIPQTSVDELIQPAGRVQRVSGQEVLDVRGSFLPLVRLDALLGLAPACEATASEEGYVVVSRVGGQRFGLWVDEVIDSEEIVVKPRPHLLKHCAAYAGATLLGDGRVAMILDVGGVAGCAALAFQGLEARPQEAAPDAGGVVSEMVVFANAPDEQFAMALGDVLRFERVPVERIQRVGEREYLPYGDGSLELIRLEDRLAAQPAAPDATEMFVLIPRHGDRAAGILASAILDTVQIDRLPEASPGDGEAVLGRMTIDDRVTRVLDAARLVPRATGGPA